MTTPPTPPLAATGTWHTVMQTAGHRCQCTGQCGNAHTRTDGRCDRVHGGWAGKHGALLRLLVAPADPARLTLPPHKAADLPAGELAAWCPACHDHTRRTAQSAPGTEAPDTGADTLF